METVSLKLICLSNKKEHICVSSKDEATRCHVSTWIRIDEEDVSHFQGLIGTFIDVPKACLPKK